MDCKQFTEEQIAHIKKTIGKEKAINALSGGVDSSLVTVLGHRALNNQLRTIFVDNALMREGEPQRVVKTFAEMGINVELVDAREEFLSALAGLTDPEKKRQAITDTFYSKLFGRLVKESGAKFLLHGTILTDIEETVAGIKRQHNILAQIGIDPEEAYGYSVIEPLKTLRKDDVREVTKFLGLPAEISQRIPFPGLWKRNYPIAERFSTWQFCWTTGRRASETINGNSGKSLWSAASRASMPEPQLLRLFPG
ncbi:MAG: asparagine synthase-related protein, partial [Planctomycetota bacterium]